jgi:hypothetical protein
MGDKSSATAAAPTNQDDPTRITLELLKRREKMLAERDAERRRNGGSPKPARAPLGIKAVADDDAERSSRAYAGESSFDPSAFSETLLNSAVSFKTLMEMVHTASDATTNAIGEAVRSLKAEIAGLRSTNEALRTELALERAALSECRSKVSGLDFVVERLRVENRGPPGPQGERGRDGRDGAQGPPGPKGNRGQRGYEISGWLARCRKLCHHA